MTKLEWLVSEAWRLAAWRPIHNALMCQTGGLTTPALWQGVATQARALVAGKAKP